jgi:hypothetical protein
MTWTTARPNWVEDILAGRSMSPSFDSLPDKARAEKALTTFKMLGSAMCLGALHSAKSLSSGSSISLPPSLALMIRMTGRQIAREILLLMAKKNTKSTLLPASW